MFYYVILPRYSASDIGATFPNNFVRLDKPEVDVNRWMYRTLKAAGNYYGTAQPKNAGQFRPPTRDHRQINALINHLDENEVFYHYEFCTSQATSDMRFINTNTFEVETDDNAWRNYFFYSVFLAVPETDAIVARLTFPDVEFVKTRPDIMITHSNSTQTSDYTI